jgi:tetratricopeptide (TPR) repeat protein
VSKHVAVPGAVILMGLIGLDARAGETRVSAPVNVVTPTASSKLYPDDLPGPQPEILRSPATLELPPIPAFELPAAEPGRHGARELRVHGRGLYGRELKVEGYVTWIYDCAAELARGNHEASAAEIAESIDNMPELCDAPMFSLGDTPRTPRDASIWVVDVPRLPRKAERAPRSRAELDPGPAPARLAVGDHVMVTGTWAVESPGGERNASGLLVYRAVGPLAPRAAAPATPAMIAAPAGLPEIEVVTEVPLRPVIETTVRNASVAHLNDCNRALAAKQYEAAITACRAATEAWDGNHLAWYAWASAHLARAEWRDAEAVIAHAVALRPDQAMYQLYDGMARYEVEVQARDDETRKAHKRPEEVAIVPPAGTLDAARDALVRAAKLAPELWRAHYYLGRIYRDLDDARRAAEQFTQTITLHPGYRPAYLALLDLYRRWGYLDQAVAVATLGTANVATDTAELWFELAMAHDAKHADDQALAALGKALASRPDDASSLLQRGEIYLRKGEPASAKRDLERVASSSDPRTAVAKRLAAQLLEGLATRSRADTSGAWHSGRRYKGVYRPSQEPYKPWNQEDAKYRFCAH